MAKVDSGWVNLLVALLALAPDVIVGVLVLALEEFAETYEPSDYDSEFNKTVDALDEKFDHIWKVRNLDISNFSPFDP